MKRLSILIADDSPDVCSLLAIWLNDHHVVSVHSGSEALSALALLYFDLVITDVNMPDVSGLEVIQRLKKFQPSVQVLAISGGSRLLTSSACVATATDAGADAALMKPFDEGQLREAIQRCLDHESTAHDGKAARSMAPVEHA